MIGIERRAVKIKQSNHRENVVLLRTIEVQVCFLSDVLSELCPALESDSLDTNWLSKLWIKPSFEKRRQGLLFCIAFDEKNELHAMASSSPDLKRAPSVYSFNQSSKSCPLSTSKVLSPSFHLATVVVGIVSAKASKN